MSEEQKRKIASAVAAKPIPTTKRCTKCNEVKPVEEFGWRMARVNLRPRSRCKKCEAADSRAAYDPGRQAAYNKAGAFRRRGITEEAFSQMLDAQGGGCAICAGKQGESCHSDRLFVDHDHETGTNRGLLCSACNTGLGYFRDDPRLLEAAVRYLRGH